ncbi:RAB6-interacting golgin isoform X2 [Pseudophryne corroboree]|uniref:RAB6-interacting golgin isoform X2 n=1 Tax=Pseudophryne corroboree TaxID=495146 RepID=UPI003081D8FF
MAGWAGFSEHELRQIKLQREVPLGQTDCPSDAFLSRQQPPGKKGLQVHTQKLGKQDKAVSARPGESKCIPKVNPPQIAMHNSAKVKKHVEEKPEASVTENTDKKSEPPSLNTKSAEQQTSTKEMELKDQSNLGQLQLEQRLIEEKNKRKKALLAKAIAERSKKTQAEAVKLKRIQKRLQALDDLVSTDVSILRNRIEQACIEFSQAKKRYDRAESEYVAAKLDLHKKTLTKEQLTEHLCTIIQQNELRKAKHLEELMQELDVETDEERLELEIEVEHMLQLQESEAKKQLLASAAEKDQQPSKMQEATPSLTENEPTADSKAVIQSAQKLEAKNGQDKITPQETNPFPIEQEVKNAS